MLRSCLLRSNGALQRSALASGPAPSAPRFLHLAEQAASAASPNATTRRASQALNAAWTQRNAAFWHQQARAYATESKPGVPLTKKQPASSSDSSSSSSSLAAPSAGQGQEQEAEASAGESEPPRIQPRLSLTFTCAVSGCGHRSTHEFSKRSYEKGIVIIQCPSCKNR